MSEGLAEVSELISSELVAEELLEERLFADEMKEDESVSKDDVPLDDGAWEGFLEATTLEGVELTMTIGL